MASPTIGQRAMVAVRIEPALLADLLRRRLVDRGVTVSDPGEPMQRAVVALVGDVRPADVEAEVWLQLHESGRSLPATVRISEAEGARLVEVDSVGDLLDMVVSIVRP